jgi:translation initiation factor 2 subunit 1
MKRCAQRLNMNLEDLYTQFCWPLYEKYGHALEAFKMAITDPDSIFDPLETPDYIKNELVNDIRHRLTPKPLKIRADIECTCFGYDGIEAIRAALTAGEECSTEDVPIKIKLLAPPVYLILTSSIDKTLAVGVLEDCIAKITSVIKQRDGNVVVKMMVFVAHIATSRF